MKEYQIKTNSYYGDNEDKNKSFIDCWKKRVDESSMMFWTGRRMQIASFLLSDMMTIKVYIANRVEIIINSYPTWIPYCFNVLEIYWRALGNWWYHYGNM